MYKNYKKYKYLKRAPGGSMGGQDVISKFLSGSGGGSNPLLSMGLSAVRQAVPDQTANVAESRGQSSTSTAAQQAVSGFTHSTLESMGPKGQIASLALKGLEAGSAAIDKNNQTCIPDPNSPTGETCFEDSSVKGALADTLNPLSTVGNVTDALTNSGSFEEGVSKLVRANPLAKAVLGESKFEKKRREDLIKANAQRARNRERGEINTAINAENLAKQNVLTSQFGSGINMYAKEGGNIFTKLKKGGGTKDACYYKVKARYKVFPSAYASGALVQCRKVGAANWGNRKKKQSGGEIFNILGDNTWQYKKQNNNYFTKKKTDNTWIPINIDTLGTENPNYSERVKRNSNIVTLSIPQKKQGGTFDKEKKEGLRGWFNRNNGKGWVDCKTGKPCGRQEGEKRDYPACRPTMADCKKYKQPKGKKSSKRYDWKKKKYGGNIAVFAYSHLQKPENINKIIGRKPQLTEHHLDGYRKTKDKSGEIIIKKDKTNTVKGKKFYVSPSELAKLANAMKPYKKEQIGGNSSYKKMFTFKKSGGKLSLNETYLLRY